MLGVAQRNRLKLQAAVQTWLSACFPWAAGISVGKGNWWLVNTALFRASVWSNRVKAWRFFNKFQNTEPLQVVDSSVPAITEPYLSESGQGEFHLNWSYGKTLPIIKEVWTSQGCWATTAQHSSQSDSTPSCQQIPATVQLSGGTQNFSSSQWKLSRHNKEHNFASDRK